MNNKFESNGAEELNSGEKGLDYLARQLEGLKTRESVVSVLKEMVDLRKIHTVVFKGQKYDVLQMASALEGYQPGVMNGGLADTTPTEMIEWYREVGVIDRED